MKIFHSLPVLHIIFNTESRIKIYLIHAYMKQMQHWIKLNKLCVWFDNFNTWPYSQYFLSLIKAVMYNVFISNQYLTFILIPYFWLAIKGKLKAFN